MANSFLAEALDMADEIVAVRRDLHMHPELGFQEVRTARIVAETLGELGYEVVTGLGKTGVVGLLSGEQPGERTVLLRFDMDALPIHEENDVPYRSQTPGVMHACGHDAHVAVGLAAARLLSKHRDKFGGTIKLMFQPAEETLGGAIAMIKDGVLEGPKIDAAFGLHVSAWHPTGTAVVRAGAMMAASDRLEIAVFGKGGHAAHPEQAIDSVVVASQLVVALQTIISRSIAADDTGVITIGSVRAGEAANVIADSAHLYGTIRSYSEDVRQKMHRRINEIAQGIALASGATIEVKITRGVDATVNAEQPTALVQEIAREVLGAENVDTTWRTTGGEDFSAVLKEVPGNFFFLGTANAELGSNFSHHHPRFDVDEAGLPYGVAILCEAAVRTLQQA